MRRPGGGWLVLLLGMGGLVFLVSSASAIPAFARRYGMGCDACHVAWPVLNEFGEDFRISGYRRYGGATLQPTIPDVELVKEVLSIPAFPPVAFRADTG